MNETGNPNAILFHALGAWRISEVFHDILWHPGAVIPASQLLGENGKLAPIRLWHDQLFCKPPKLGGNVAWHQDYSYWTRTKPLAHLTFHIALDDQTIENGCLYYVPGTHKWDLLPITSRHFTDMESIFEVLDEEQRKIFKPIPTLLKKGEMSIHHSKMVHGSYLNQSDGPRRATVINFIRDGVVSDTNTELLEQIPIFSPGEKLEGQFFPLLYGGRK